MGKPLCLWELNAMEIAGEKVAVRRHKVANRNSTSSVIILAILFFIENF
jgi:hypothetical protein